MYILLAIVCILHRYLRVRELQVSDRQVVTWQNWSASSRLQKPPLLSATFFTMWLRLHISLSHGIVTARARALTISIITPLSAHFSLLKCVETHETMYSHTINQKYLMKSATRIFGNYVTFVRKKRVAHFITPNTARNCAGARREITGVRP